MAESLSVPTQGEKRERELRKLVVRSGKPVALFIDEAHDLHSRTLNGLKRPMEVGGRGGGNLSVILIGHPKLRNDLRRPTMEEIGHRTDVLGLRRARGGYAGLLRLDARRMCLGGCAAEHF